MAVIGAEAGKGYKGTVPALKLKMTPEQINEARRLVSAFKSRNKVIPSFGKLPSSSSGGCA